MDPGAHAVLANFLISPLPLRLGQRSMMRLACGSMNSRSRLNVFCARWEKSHNGSSTKIMRDEIKELNNETRKFASGSFIQLANGITHYELGGNESGEV